LLRQLLSHHSIAFHIIEQAIGVTRISTVAILNIQDTQKRT